MGTLFTEVNLSDSVRDWTKKIVLATCIYDCPLSFLLKGANHETSARGRNAEIAATWSSVTETTPGMPISPLSTCFLMASSEIPSTLSTKARATDDLALALRISFSLLACCAVLSVLFGLGLRFFKVCCAKFWIFSSA